MVDTAHRNKDLFLRKIRRSLQADYGMIMAAVWYISIHVISKNCWIDLRVYKIWYCGVKFNPRGKF